MTPYDPDLDGDDLDVSLLDYDDLDAIEQTRADRLRERTTGLPARPGTRR